MRTLDVRQIHVTTIGGSLSWGGTEGEGEATLFMDYEEHVYYLDISKEIGFHDEQSILFLIDQLDFEIMEEYECPPEIQSDGRMRFWLARKYDDATPLRLVA